MLKWNKAAQDHIKQGLPVFYYTVLKFTNITV
jgi:hypothetical protein